MKEKGALFSLLEEIADYLREDRTGQESREWPGSSDFTAGVLYQKIQDMLGQIKKRED